VREKVERELRLEPANGFRLPALEGREFDPRVFYVDVLRHAAA
jgi:hypothetical protein